MIPKSHYGRSGSVYVNEYKGQSRSDSSNFIGWTRTCIEVKFSDKENAMQLFLVVCLLIITVPAPSSQDKLPIFKEQTIDPAVGVGYAVSVADINHDGKTDIVAVTENPDQVSGTRTRAGKNASFVEGLPKLPVCVQPLDVDNDGKVELVLGADWQPSNSRTGGTSGFSAALVISTRQWTPIKIDEEPTMHRMRVMDVDGKGRKELVCSPLQGRETKGP